MSSTRASVAGALLCAALAIGLAFAQPDLRPVMPEVDGVHPVRAVQALRDAFVPGRGFLDKYPPLGSFLFGLLAAAGDDGALAAQADAVTAAPPAVRRELLWPLRDPIQAALRRERWLSRLAAGGAAAVVFLLARRLAGGGAFSFAGPLLAGAAFAACATLRVCAGSVNVDAPSLLPALLACLLLLQRRWVQAGASLALAVALKDPHVALVPVVLAGAGFLGGRRALLAAAAAAAGVYALASGALTGPVTWWEHLRLLAAGMGPVDRIDRTEPGDWLGLLRHTGWLLAEGWSGALLLGGGLAALGMLVRSGAREARLVLVFALAPIVLFTLPVGYAYARFLLVTQALLAVALGAAPAWAAAGGRRRAATAWLVLGGLGLLSRLLLAPLPAPQDDARAALPARLAAHLPQGGRVLLFADEREHGPPLDPARWQLDVRGLNEVGPALAALRERPAAERPEAVLVMGFGNELPSGAPREEAPRPAAGERVGGMYVVREVLDGPPGWARRAIAVAPRITLLVRDG